MFEKKSKIITLEILTKLCEEELARFHPSKSVKQIKSKAKKISKSVTKDSNEVKKIKIKQPGEDILWL